MDGEKSASKFKTLSLIAAATAVALIVGFVSSAPARADILLLAGGGGGGAGYYVSLPGENGQAGPNGSNGVGPNGGLGGVNGGGGQGGQNGNWDGAGGAGWNGNGGAGSGGPLTGPYPPPGSTSNVPGGGLSRPSFAGGAGGSVGVDVGANSGGFGGGGGGGWNSGGGGGGYSGGGGGDGSNSLVGGSSGGGGGGGSFIAGGFTNTTAVSGANGTPNGGGGAGLDGYVTIIGAGVNESYSYVGSIQNFVAPFSETYTILAAGAQGGSAQDPTDNGGYGALVGGQINLTAGTDLSIIVGQAGLTGVFGYAWAGGGGGGSFVFESPGPVPGAGRASLAFLLVVGALAHGRRLLTR